MAGVGTLTVLFTDLVGSTALASEVGDVVVSDLRRAHFGALGAAAAATGGEEIKNLGDGLMIVYRSASDAIDGSVAMQRAVSRGNVGAAVPLAMKVGISVGDVSEEGGDWFGTPVNEAARLCAAATGGQILVADIVRVLAGTRARHSIVPAGTRELKGLPQPVAVCEVVWEPSEARLDVAYPFPDDPAPLVGRIAELEVLLEHWRDAKSGRSTAVFIGGDAGIGKTRLARAAARSVHEDGGAVLVGRCDEMLPAAFRPWIEVLRAIIAAADPQTIRDWAGVRTRELPRIVPELSERLPDLEPPSAGDPEAERFALFEAVTALLTGAGAAMPTSLVLDDMQWADPASILLLRHVLRAAGDGRLLVIATYRESEVPDGSPLARLILELRRDRVGERISLVGLDEAEIRSFLSQRAGAEVPLAFAALVASETGGNPFFVDEVVDHLEERGSFGRRGDAWTMPTTAATLGVPEGVRELVRQRASRLRESTQQLMGIAALVGRVFDLGVVADAADVKEAELLDALDEAAATRLVLEVDGDPEHYRFEHDLTRAAIAESVGSARRARVHQRIAEAIEPRHPDDVAALAHHYTEATTASARKALEYSVRRGTGRARGRRVRGRGGSHRAGTEGTGAGGRRRAVDADRSPPAARRGAQRPGGSAGRACGRPGGDQRGQAARRHQPLRAGGAPLRSDRRDPRHGRGLERPRRRSPGAVAARRLGRAGHLARLPHRVASDHGPARRRSGHRPRGVGDGPPRGRPPGDRTDGRGGRRPARGAPVPRERVERSTTAIEAGERVALPRGSYNSLQWYPAAHLELGERSRCEAALSDLEHRARVNHLEEALVVLAGTRCLLLQIEGRFDEADAARRRPRPRPPVLPTPCWRGWRNGWRSRASGGETRSSCRRSR